MGKGSDSRQQRFQLRGGHAPAPSVTERLQQEQHDAMSYSSTGKLRNNHSNNSSNIPKGLVNVGNSCYANAVLQCLLSTALVPVLLDPKASAIFRRYSSNPRLLEQGSGSVDSSEQCNANQNTAAHHHDNSSNRNVKEQQHQAMRENCTWLTRELKNITLQYQQSQPLQQSQGFSILPSQLFSSSNNSNSVIDPGSLTRHPHRLSPCLTPYQQEDAHEFLRALLSTLVMNGQHKQLSSLFDGLLESALTCLTCRKPSLTRDRYMDLSLDICSPHVHSLQDALEEFTATETLSGDNRVYCANCQSKRNATKGLRLATAPSILVIHLKRFALQRTSSSNNQHQLVRLSKPIQFDLRLDISDYVSRVNKARPPPYELVAVLVHEGRSCECGHYVAYTRQDGHWYKCNDATVERVSVETVLQQQAYILVYEVAEMRRKHGYASPSGSSNDDNKATGGARQGNGRRHASVDPKSDFMKLLSNSLCGGLDDLMLQDFCWDVSSGICQKDKDASSTRRNSASSAVSSSNGASLRRRRRRDESLQQQRHHFYRSSDISVDPHDDLSTLGESTVDTADTSSVPFRRSCSSGNLKHLQARDKISHSTGRPSQRSFFTTSNNHVDVASDASALLPDYKTAKRWAEARKAAAATTNVNTRAATSPRRDKAGSTPRAPAARKQLPPRHKAPSKSQRRAGAALEPEGEECFWSEDGTMTDEGMSALTSGAYDD